MMTTSATKVSGFGVHVSLTKIVNTGTKNAKNLNSRESTIYSD